jgi:hypothetical protein
MKMVEHAMQLTLTYSGKDMARIYQYEFEEPT